MTKKSIVPTKIEVDAELFAPCGMFCGLCSSYLAQKYKIPKRPGIVSYCIGCRSRDKQCSFVKKRCDCLLNHEIKFCSECDNFPCTLLEKIEYKYVSKFKYSYSFQQALHNIQEFGTQYVIDSLKKDHGCKKCGEILCIHNGLCYHCNKDQLAVMKNYRNDP